MPERQMLGQRALNRALLERQLLLQRANLDPLDVIEHLVGMQAQAPNAPYVGLWTRLADFQPGQLARLITGHEAVRAHVMRGTIHLVSAHDCLTLRALVQPVLARAFAGSPFARNLAGIDLDVLGGAGRALLDERPRTRAELSQALGQRWPDHDPVSLAYAITYLEPTVQVPPRGIWGATGQATYTTTQAWLGRRLMPPPAPEDVVTRYLAAFGPATVKDMQACGLTRLREVTDRMRPQLRIFRGERGDELLDLPGVPRPDPQTPAPPRFLPEYDNVLLSHADRTRVVPGNRRVPLPPGSGAARGTVLIDGFWRATWEIVRQRDTASLHIEPFTRISKEEAGAVTAEGARLLTFAAADSTAHDVRLATAAPA